MKKLLSIIISIIILSSQIISAAPSPSPSVSGQSSSTTVTEKNVETAEKEDTFPTPHSQAAILIDRKSGDILYEKNINQKLYPASTTKIMTAVLALEKGVLTDSVTATREAIEPITSNHSHMGIKVGETLTLEQLLYGMLVYSANDAANVIAVHIGGSLEGFSAMMNEKALELGLSGTHYQNAHGYHDDNHYTTAKDLSTLARYAMEKEKFQEIVKTVLYRIPANDYYTEERVLSTTNHLISRYRNTKYMYKYAIGIKTGYTEESGSCLVAAATKGDMELISVILKADESEDGTLYTFADSARLYEYTFENYKYIKVADIDQVVSDSPVYEARNATRVALLPSQNLEKILPKTTDVNDISANITLNEKITAPIKKGDVLGSVTYTLSGKTLGTVELVAGNDVKRDYILAIIHFFVNIITSPFFYIPLLIIIWLLISSNRRRRKRRQKRRSQLKYANQPRKR